MLAFAVLALASLSRILPHLFHATAWNFTALGGGLLFFGSQLGSQLSSQSGTDRSSNTGRIALKLAGAVAALAATDYYLTVFAYGYAFHLSEYAVTWCWYALACILGMGLLSKPSPLRVVAGVLASATSFFALSNFTLWVGGHMYARTAQGLADCYLAAIPFYRNDLVSTALTAGALFGLPVLATRIEQSLHAAQNHTLPRP